MKPYEVVAPNGQMMSFELDIDKICAWEDADPGRSFFKDLESLGTAPKLSIFCRLCDFCGVSYSDFIDAGFTMGDISGIVTECMSLAGFRSAGQASD